MKRLKIVLIGGGSVGWTPTIVRDMLLTPSLRDVEFVLYDCDEAAARRMAVFLERLRTDLQSPAAITATADAARAFRGARYFVITISTGGLDAMASDLAIPESYGIYHTVGDTSGPGGWARAIRNFGVFQDLAAAINRYAPGATVLNYTNPMGFLTGELAQLCHGPVVGLCHALFDNLAFFKDFYALKSEDDLAVRYAGLNHFIWITAARAGSRDLLADLRRRLKTQTFTDLMAEIPPDAHGFSSNRELATVLFRQTGSMPYLGDRHTCEFLSPYITNRKTMRHYRLVRTTIAQRKEGLQKGRARVQDWLAASELPDWLRQRSRETAADIIAAHFEGRAFVDVGNVPNIGQIDGLPAGTVVETPVRVDALGFSPLAQGRLPEAVLALLEPCARMVNQTLAACFQGDREAALQALQADPVCAHLTATQVREMGQRLLHAHRRWIKAF